MAMIRSLGADYSSFVSAITLMDNLDMSKLKDAFITEESNRKAMEEQTEVSAAAHFTSTKPTSAVICGWWERPGHAEDNCFSKKASQQQDRANAKSRRYRGKRTTSSNSSTNSSSTASANSASNSTESAINASVFNISDATSSLTPSPEWCADSGATSHMTPHRDWFVNYTPHVIPIMIADGTVIHSAGIGSVQFKPVLRGGAPGKLVVFSRVLHVPCLSRPLLSMNKLTLESDFKIVM